MEAFLGMVLVLGFFVGFSALVIWLGARQAAQAKARLQVLAEQLGLQLHERPKQFGWIAQIPEVRGVRRGKEVRIYHYSTGSGKSRTHWAAVAVKLPIGAALTFRFSPQGLGSKVMALFGAREIEVGDTDFDRHWFVQTNAPEFLRAALLPELRTRLQTIVRKGGSGTYETVEGAVRYAERGWFTDQARCARFADVVEAACDLADVADVHAQHARR